MLQYFVHLLHYIYREILKWITETKFLKIEEQLLNKSQVFKKWSNLLQFRLATRSCKVQDCKNIVIFYCVCLIERLAVIKQTENYREVLKKKRQDETELYFANGLVLC